MSSPLAPGTWAVTLRTTNHHSYGQLHPVMMMILRTRRTGVTKRRRGKGEADPMRGAAPKRHLMTAHELWSGLILLSPALVFVEDG